jgi:uncharacterized protein YraI
MLLLGGWTAAPEGTGPGPALGTVSKLPVPRFVSLRTGEVNVRAGPGFQYPVSWVYQRDGLPVEIIGEFDVWRQILAPDGGTGWVHMATIRPRRRGGGGAGFRRLRRAFKLRISVGLVQGHARCRDRVLESG